ncbi:hypothetical protein H6P81_005385 [Aristolochia fimbriata]|uniref:RING-type E3 ubiquitin transferase n=1 Tax=Aristolochia fimbriata TaxID=158543 RepID=A0AAV7EVF1_ARIFI|nr:hypothetical protein H6P81_005385 [Aristolochia fimbriata]
MASPAQGLNPSILIIALIVTIVFMLSLAIHLLLRFLDRNFRASVADHGASQAAPPPQPNYHHHHHQHSNPMFNRRVSPEQQSFIDSLPAFPFNSVAASGDAHKDCAVCLAHFEPHDRLRLLPACCHAFHADCIDTWLASNRTCPLCRSTIDAAPPSEKSDKSEGSFRLEIGSISRRESSDAAAWSRRRSYSVGSFDYVVDDEAEVVIAATAPPPKDSASEAAGAPPPPGEEVAEAAGGRGGWLKEYVDRLASASSSLSARTRSFRFSGRLSGMGSVSSRRTESWDLEGNPVGEEDGFSNFLRWLSGM